MPERQDDNNGKWSYPTVYPGANLKLNRNAVRIEDGLVEATGLDGRFIGALRPFPGMADATVHGVPKPSGATTITSLTNIVFAKYAAIQKGYSNDILKGIVYIADNPGATGKAVYFAYYDSSDDSSDVRLLEDLDTWTDFKLTSYDNYDIAFLGRYIYASFVGATTSTVSSFTNKKPPYNKAYFWDFKINSWDAFVTGFDDRFMSILPERLLATNLNADGPGSRNSDDDFDAETYSPTGSASDMPVLPFTYAAEVVSKKHNLRSYIRYRTKTPTVGGALRFMVSGLKLVTDYSSFIQQLRGNSQELTTALEWGIQKADGFRLFRGPGDDIGMATDKYSYGNVYEIDPYIAFGVLDSGSGVLAPTIDHDIDEVLQGDYNSTVFSDEALLSQPQYNPTIDAFGAAPRLKRITAYDGLLVGIVDVEEPGAFNVQTKENEKSSEAIVWSTLSLPEPENFPAENYYRPDSPAERFLALEPAGDHLFGITNSGIYKITRGGGNLGISKMATAVGGVSRNGATGVGSSLFIVTAAGVKELDGNTSEVRSVSQMDRIILDDSEWAGSLTSVSVKYDAKLGALIFLNTSAKECYILWEATGAVTKIIDCPWVYLTSGPEAKIDGPQRAYFVTSAGTVHTIDGSRTMGKRSMCGTTISETVNGSITTASSTNIIDSAATFPVNCVGFKVYILSGARIGDEGTITVRNSATNLSVTGLGGTLATTTRYSVAPIVTRVILPQLLSPSGNIDPFVRKIVTGMSVAFSDLAGEYTGDNGNVTMGVKDGGTTLTTTEIDLDLVPDQCVGRVNGAAVRLHPFVELKGGNIDFEIQAVLVSGVASISEAQSRQGT